MTIAKQLKVQNFPLIITDSQNKQIYFETSDGYWIKREYDERGNRIRFETSTGYWSICEYDEKDREIYFENSEGDITDNRPETDVQKAIELLEKNGYRIFKYI